MQHVTVKMHHATLPFGGRVILAKRFQNSVTHLGSSVHAGSLAVSAGQDITAMGSALTAEGDASLTAGGSVTFGAVSNERYNQFKYSSSKTTVNAERYDMRAQGSSLTAGGNLSVTARDGNITAVASRLSAQGDAALSAAALGPERGVAGVFRGRDHQIPHTNLTYMR